MATFRQAFRFLRSNASVSLMFLIYILMWWMPLRPFMIIASGRSDIPYGINGPLEWMSRWWLSADAPTLFQPIALLGAWMLAYQRVGILRATWARTCRSATRRGAKWAKYSWMPLAVLLCTGAVSFLGHITPLAITTLVWLPIGVVFYIYGPRVTRFSSCLQRRPFQIPSLSSSRRPLSAFSVRSPLSSAGLLEKRSPMMRAAPSTLRMTIFGRLH